MEYLGWTVSPVTQTKIIMLYVIMMKNIDYKQGLQHIRTGFKMIDPYLWQLQLKALELSQDILSDR